jgi:hypothetical protein
MVGKVSPVWWRAGVFGVPKIFVGRCLLAELAEDPGIPVVAPPVIPHVDLLHTRTRDEEAAHSSQLINYSKEWRSFNICSPLPPPPHRTRGYTGRPHTPAGGYTGWPHTPAGDYTGQPHTPAGRHTG